MLRRLLILPFLLLLFLLPLLMSCDGHPQDDLGQNRTPLTIGDGPQADFTDAKGHRFVWKEKHQAAPKTEPTLHSVTEVSVKAAALGDQSPQALAEKLRPHLFTVDGHEFVGDTFSPEQIREILAAVPEVVTDEPKEDPGVRRGEFVLVNNSSVLDCDRLTSPHRSEVWFDGGCSGILIGSHTVISAGHCFYQNGSWVSNTTIVPATDDGMSTCNQRTPYFGWTSWSVALPSAWVNNADSNYDFAIISVNGEPGSYTGWLPVLNWSNTLTAELRRSSFPWGVSGFSRYPVEWRTTGNAGSPYTSSIYAYSNDSWSGDSGGGVYLASQMKIVGTHIGALTYGCGYFGLSTCYTNIYRKWDSTYDSYARAYGNWP